MGTKKPISKKERHDKSLAAAAKGLREAVRLITAACVDIRTAADNAPCMHTNRTLLDMRVTDCRLVHRLEAQAETFEQWLASDRWTALNRKTVLREVKRAIKALTSQNQPTTNKEHK